MPGKRPSLPRPPGWTLLIPAFLAILLLYQSDPKHPPDSQEAAPVSGQWAGHDETLDLTPTQAEGIAVYFTRPEARSGFRGGPDARLASAIEQAQLSVDVAAMQLDLWSLRDALLDAHRRGVQVRLAADNDTLNEEEVEALVQAGIPVHSDREESLMHHKFVVIDRQQVWTGSMNFTVNGAYRHNNNLVGIRSAELAADYTAEFEEMFTDSRFGIASRADTPYPQINVDGIEMEVRFSPDEGAAERIIELIEKAQRNIQFMAFSFTSDEIAAAMIARAEAGVEVSGIFEADQVESNLGSEYETLRQAGLDVRRDGNPDQMHHKVMIIDGITVITGSYNFSANAETRNDENTLIMHGEALAGEYLEEYERLWAEAR